MGKEKNKTFHDFGTTKSQLVMGLLRGGQQPTPTTTAMKEDLFLLLLLLSFLPGLAAAGQTSPVADAAEMIADFVACNSDNVINVASMPTTANRNMR